jgi:hypothetical protein
MSDSIQVADWIVQRISSWIGVCLVGMCRYNTALQKAKKYFFQNVAGKAAIPADKGRFYL